MSRARPAWAVAGAGFVILALVAVAWLAVDRRPPAWDYANHMERALRCARDLAAGDLAAVLERSSFYPPLALCSAGLLQRLTGSDVIAGQAVMLGFLGLGMAATFMLGRRVAGAAGGAVAALIYGAAPFVVFLAFRFQLDLPLAGMVALMLELLLRTDGFRRSGWSIVAGVVAGLGLLTKPPFAAYILPAAIGVAPQVRDRRAVVNAAVATAVGVAIALPWYGPRLFGLQAQVSTRAFKQAAEQGIPDPLTWAGLMWYPSAFVAEFGVAAVALFGVGLIVAVRRRHWWWLFGLLAPFAMLVLIQNKNPRYTLPLLPLAAVIAALGWSALPARGRAVTGAALAVVTALQVSATAGNTPPERIPGLGLRFAIASPPMRADWRHREILALISRDSGGVPVTVSVVPNHELFSVSNFRYYAIHDGLALTFTRAWDREPLGVAYMIVKTGDVGPPWTEARIRRIEARLVNDPHLARVFPVIGELLLPDGSVATVRARRLPAAAASPAAVAAAVEHAIRRQIGDVARNLDGFEARLAWDETISQGRIARVDVRAASATIGEFRRAGSAQLRVADVRVVFDGVLINPYSAYADGRLDLLDVGAIRVDRVTVTADDFQAFVRALRKFRPIVEFERGALGVRIPQFGPDLTGRVTIAPSSDRPFELVAWEVRMGGVPLPSALAKWAIRTFDPLASLARRLPAPVAIGRVTITPDAIRIASGG